ncbi:MAG: ferritin family protein [Acidobacteriota bacterium]
MKPLETTVEEVLRKAIQDEVATRAYYQALSERSTDPSVRKRMLQLADGELVHRAKLERKYREMVGSAPPDPQPARVDLPSDVADLDLRRALKHALERERDSESYFRHMAERIPPPTELGKLFVELAEVEWKHKTELQAEYDAAGAPEAFLLDM